MSRRLAALAAVVIALAIGACAKHHPVAPTPAAPLVADSPENAMRLLVSGWTRRDSATCLALLADDFVFVFQTLDEAGVPYATTPWNLTHERIALGHMFVGGGALAPAKTIQWAIDAALFPRDDDLPGKDPRWHRLISTNIQMRCQYEQNGATAVITVSGEAAFHFVRGDSAALSGARVARGEADSTRWFLERWEDFTVGGPAKRFQPIANRNMTWGYVQAAYLPSATRATGPATRATPTR